MNRYQCHDQTYLEKVRMGNEELEMRKQYEVFFNFELIIYSLKYKLKGLIYLSYFQIVKFIKQIFNSKFVQTAQN